jgi:hypothetical protein
MALAVMDGRLNIESFLGFFLVLRVIFYITMVWSLPHFICKKLDLDKEQFKNDDQIKGKLLRVQLYLIVLFTLVEGLMIHRGVWL